MEENQTKKQLKIALAQSEFAPIVIELLRECMDQTELVGDSEYSTVVNAVRFDTQSEIIRRVVEHLENIRQGALHEIK